MQVVTVDRRGAPEQRDRAARARRLARGRRAACARRAATPLLARDVRRLAESFGSTSAIYVQNLATGAGAAWNARATFPGASSLKLAIAVTALARTEGTPGPGSTLDRLLRQMLIYSDNAAANGTERYFGGSTSGGSALVNSMMQSLGLVDTEMYGGYELDAVGEPLARARRRDPAPGRQPAELGPGQEDERLRPREPAPRASGSRAAAVARCAPPSRASPPPTPATCSISSRTCATPARSIARSAGCRACAVLHKAGWINVARHDNGIVLWPGGALVVTVMTHRSGGRRGLVRRARGQGRRRRAAPLPRLTSGAR